MPQRFKLLDKQNRGYWAVCEWSYSLEQVGLESRHFLGPLRQDYNCLMVCMTAISVPNEETIKGSQSNWDEDTTTPSQEYITVLKIRIKTRSDFPITTFARTISVAALRTSMLVSWNKYFLASNLFQNSLLAPNEKHLLFNYLVLAIETVPQC